MKQLARGFNANTIIIMIVSALLCYMQKKVLDAVDTVPVLIEQMNQVKGEIQELKHRVMTLEDERGHKP